MSSTPTDRLQYVLNFYKDKFARIIGLSDFNLKEIRFEDGSVQSVFCEIDEYACIVFSTDGVQFGLRNLDQIDAEILKALNNSRSIYKVFSSVGIREDEIKLVKLSKADGIFWKILYEKVLSLNLSKTLYKSITTSLSSILEIVKPLKQKILEEIANDQFVARIIAEKLKEDKTQIPKK